MRSVAPVLFCFYLLLLTYNTNAQKKSPASFGKIAVKDFTISSPLIDSNSNAVIIADVADSRFAPNSIQTDFAIEFNRFTRIKLLNKNSFDIATVEIPLYIEKENQEELSSLKAYTYILKNGSITRIPLDKESVFTEKVDKNHIVKKFTLPSISEGCIIEFAYTIKSEFYFNLQDWNFQNKYPTLWSEYTVEIPQFFKYMFLGAGKEKYHINDTKDFVDAFPFYTKAGFDAKNGGASQDAAYTIRADVRRYRWVMKDIPAIKTEPFVFSLQNHINSIQFQLAEIQYSETPPTKIMSDWNTVIADLMNNENFGFPLQQVHPWLNNEVDRLIEDTMSETTRARIIYEYVRDNFTSNEKHGIYLNNPLKKVYDQQTGSVAEINLLLICMLRKAEVKTVPVILGTREHGVTHQFYPLLDRYNYVLAAIFIDTATILLDASKRNLAFGKIPGNCYNGYARMLYENSESFYLSPDDIVDAKVVSIFLNKNKNGFEGTFTSSMGYFESLQTRDAISQSGLESYKKDLADQQEIIVTDIQLKDLRNLDKNLSLEYKIKIPVEDANTIYFSPLAVASLKKNPFQADVRYYPIELPYRIEGTYVVNLQVPEGYTVDEMPTSVKILLNENEGMFEYLIRQNGQAIQLRSKIVLYKSTYSSEDYTALRDFYAFVIQKQNEQIVFKKN